MLRVIVVAVGTALVVGMILIAAVEGEGFFYYNLRLSNNKIGGSSSSSSKEITTTQQDTTQSTKHYEKSNTNTGDDELDVAYLNARYGSSVDTILEWVCLQAQTKPIVQFTSFGASSLVILHKLQRRNDDCLHRIPVVTIDTLHLFPETYMFLHWAAVNNDYGILATQLQVYGPKGYTRKEDFDRDFGPDLYKTNPEKYAWLTKIEPTQRALDDLRPVAWITGRRRSQGGDRSSLQAFEREEGHHRLKINPLVDWTYEQVWGYIRHYQLPYNDLFDQGYKSIGDVQTTASVSHTAEERSGRFQGLNRSECGMHEISSWSDHHQLGHGTAPEEPNANGKYYVDVTPKTFDRVVLEENKTSSASVLLLFYAPKCEHCRVFAPTFLSLARDFYGNKTSSGVHHYNIRAARFNTKEHHIPRNVKHAGFRVTGTPNLFLVQHHPLRITKHSGKRDKESILKWLREHGER